MSETQTTTTFCGWIGCFQIPTVQWSLLPISNISLRPQFLFYHVNSWKSPWCLDNNLKILCSWPQSLIIWIPGVIFTSVGIRISYWNSSVVSSLWLMTSSKYWVSVSSGVHICATEYQQLITFCICANLSSLKNRNYLQELHLEKCRIYLPDVYQHFEKSVVHVNLRRFRFLSDHVSLKWHPFLTRCIAVYMPKLIELEIQPQAASGMWTSNFCRRIVHTKHGWTQQKTCEVGNTESYIVGSSSVNHVNDSLVVPQ